MRKLLLVPLLPLALGACSTLPRGGYYSNDGPPRRDVDLTRVADPIPHPEPLSADGNEPYSVFGHTYYPMKDARGYRERGIASWYGTKFHGRRTSSGEAYDMYAMTAAHCTLPLPTYLRVSNLRNGRSVIVRVNDRGPFMHNRLIDLSYAAAAKLGIIGTGTGLVEIEAIDTANQNPMVMRASANDAAVEARVADDEPPPQLYLQVGAFNNWENAVSLRARLTQAHFEPVLIQTEVRNNVPLYRVRVGPLASVNESDRLIERASAYGFADARVVIE
jgi:rare lipoprotein A